MLQYLYCSLIIMRREIRELFEHDSNFSLTMWVKLPVKAVAAVPRQGGVFTDCLSERNISSSARRLPHHSTEVPEATNPLTVSDVTACWWRWKHQQTGWQQILSIQLSVTPSARNTLRFVYLHQSGSEFCFQAHTFQRWWHNNERFGTAIARLWNDNLGLQL